MKLPKELVTVTPLSKVVALILFISLPITAFIYGVKYKETLNGNSTTTDSPTLSMNNESAMLPTGECLHTPSLQINAKGGEILLINNQNNKTGFDNDLKKYVQQINGSIFTSSEIVPPGEQPNNVIDREIFITEKANGEYELRIYGFSLNADEIPGPTFSINFSGADECLNAINTMSSSLTGSIKTGDVIKYKIVFDPKNGIQATKL